MVEILGPLGFNGDVSLNRAANIVAGTFVEVISNVFATYSTPQAKKLQTTKSIMENKNLANPFIVHIVEEDDLVTPADAVTFQSAF